MEWQLNSKQRNSSSWRLKKPLHNQYLVPRQFVLLPAQALWVDWQPDTRQADPSTWRLWKLSSPVDPAGVIFNGSRSLHGVGDRGIHIDGAGCGSWERLNIRCGCSLDAAVNETNIAVVDETKAACCTDSVIATSMSTAHGSESWERLNNKLDL